MVCDCITGVIGTLLLYLCKLVVGLEVVLRLAGAFEYGLCGYVCFVWGVRWLFVLYLVGALFRGRDLGRFLPSRLPYHAVALALGTQ